MAVLLKHDNTLRFERVNRYRKLILEYEMIKT
jgi:hypothetical protein